MENKKLFQIGDVAKMFHISVGSLRRYEQAGLLKPEYTDPDVENPWHQSRHTAATTVFLSNGVPIETVSSMLGHKSIKTTQIYAKITKEKLNQDMENLVARLSGIEEFAGCTI